MSLDPKAVLIRPQGHVAQQWEVRVPANVAYGDLFTPSTWAMVEKFMRQRGGKNPRKDDLLRILGSAFDVVCRIDAVSDGYQLSYFAGRKPPPLLQVLADLDALPIVAAAEINRAKNLSRRWQAMGASREDLSTARKRFAQQHHPDSNATDGRKLAMANSVLDAALESISEAA